MEAVQAKLSNSSFIKEVLDEDPQLKSQWKLAKQYKNNAKTKPNIDELIQKTIERVKQRQSGLDQQRESRSTAQGSSTKMKLLAQSSATSAQSTSIKNVQPIQQTEEEVKSDEELGSEELSFEDLRAIDEHVAGAGRDLDLQSKIFDQILSMPIGASNGGAHGAGPAGAAEPSSPHPLAPGKQSTDPPTAANLVDNKEILSFQTKPANMSMSMKNGNSDRKQSQVQNKIVSNQGALLRDSKASKAKNMQNLESHSSVISKNLQKQTPYFLGQSSLKQKSSLGAARSPVLTNARRSSGQGSKRPSTQSSQTGVSKKRTPIVNQSVAEAFMQATKSTYVSLIDKAEAMRSHKSKSRGRPAEASKRVSGPKISSFKSPNLNVRSRQPMIIKDVKNRTGNQAVTSSGTTISMNSSKLAMTSLLVSSTLKIPRKEAKSKDRLVIQDAIEEDDDSNIKGTYETAQVAYGDGESRLAPSVAEAHTAREHGASMSNAMKQALQPWKQNSSPLFKSRFIKKKDSKVDASQENSFLSPSLAQVWTPSNAAQPEAYGVNIQKNLVKKNENEIHGRVKSPNPTTAKHKVIQAEGARTHQGHVRRQSRADQKASVKRLYNGQVQGALNDYLKSTQNQRRSPKTSIITTFSDAEMQSSARQQTTAANPTLTMSQIQNGFNRKKSGVIERPKSQTMMRTDKTKARRLFSATKECRKQSKVIEQERHQPPQQSFIPKSKDYLKNTFETEFWPIVQELLYAEVERRLTLVLDGKNLYDHGNNRLTYEQLFANNFQSTDIEILKLKEVKEQVGKRNSKVMIKSENVEEILIKMGFMRSRENVEDKIEFMNLKELLQLHQESYRKGYATQAHLSTNKSKPKAKKGESIRLSDTDNNLDAYLMRDSNIQSHADENSDSDVDFKLAEEDKEDLFVGEMSKPCGEMEKGIADEPSAQRITATHHKLTYQLGVGEEMTQTGALLYALLNITGIWNAEVKMPRQYSRLRENRDKFFRREIKATIQTLQIEQQTSDSKKKVTQLKLEKSKSNGSLSQRQIPQKGFFGSQQQHLREYEKQQEKQQEILKNMTVHTSNKTNDLFATSLRSYAPPIKGLKSPKRAIDRKKTSQGLSILDDITTHSPSTSQINLKVPAQDTTTFSLKSIGNNMTILESNAQPKNKSKGPLQLDFHDAIKKFEQKKAEMIMTSRSQKQLGSARGRLDTVRSQQSPQPRNEKMLNMSLEFDEEVNTIQPGNTHNTVLNMTPCSPGGSVQPTMILHSEFGTSNYNKSKQYDTCIYNAEAMESNQSQFQETPNRKHDTSSSYRRPLNKSQKRDSSHSATRQPGVQNSYASLSHHRKNYLYEQHQRNAGKTLQGGQFNSQRSQSNQRQNQSIELHSPITLRTQSKNYQQNVYTYNTEIQQITPDSQLTKKVKSYDYSPEQMENAVNITSTFKAPGSDEMLQLSPDLRPRQSMEQKFSLLSSLRQTDANLRSSNLNNQTFAMAHSKTNSMSMTPAQKDSIDGSLAGTPSMSQIPLHELDQKIKDIEDEYNSIVTKENNLKQKQTLVGDSNFEVSEYAKQDEGRAQMKINANALGVRQSDELLLNDLQPDEKNSMLVTITSPTDVMEQDSFQATAEEELPRITEEASRLENTQIEDSAVIDNAQNQYLNADLIIPEDGPASRNGGRNDNGIYQFPRSGTATPCLSYIGANEEIKEEFREDSESSNEFISQILNTQDEQNNSIENLMEPIGIESLSAAEICETRRTYKEKLQLEMISDLKDEAQDFMSKQESIRIGTKGARVSQSVENTHRKQALDEEEHRVIGREFLSGLFKDEDEQIAIDKVGGPALSSWAPNSAKKLMNKKPKKMQSPATMQMVVGKKRRGQEGMSSKPPVAVKPSESKQNHILKSLNPSDNISGSATSTKKKFISKFAQKNLQPVEKITQSAIRPYSESEGIPHALIQQSASQTQVQMKPQAEQILSTSAISQQQQQCKSRRQGGQPKQNANHTQRNSNAGVNSSRIAEQTQRPIDTSQNFGSSIFPDNTDRQNESFLLQQMRDELHQNDAMNQSSYDIAHQKWSGHEYTSATRNSHHNNSIQQHLRSNTLSMPSGGNEHKDLSLDFDPQEESNVERDHPLASTDLTPQMKAEPRSASHLDTSRRSIQLAPEGGFGGVKTIDSSDNSSLIFKIPKSDKSMFKNVTSQYGDSEARSPAKTEMTEAVSNEVAEQPRKVIKFEIFVDETVGTQLIEIHDRKHIAEHVERFALKFEIRSRTKINKLKKYIKSQFKQESGALLL